MKYLVRIAVGCGLLAIIGAFDNAVKNPIITFFTIGFYVKDWFVKWHLAVIGWVFCIILEILVIYNVLQLCAFLVRKLRKLCANFKRSGRSGK